MYQTMSSLPPPDIQPPVNFTESGKRQWETNKTGYVNWALQQLLARSKVGQIGGQMSVDGLDAAAAEIATGDELQQALHSFDGESPGGRP